MKRWIALILLMVVALCLSGCHKNDDSGNDSSSVPTVETSESKYNQGLEMLANNQFEAAAAVFEKLGSYMDSSKLCMYCKAVAAGNNGDYETAIISLRSLGSLKDSDFWCAYFTARQNEDKAFQNVEVPDWKMAIEVAGKYDLIKLFNDSETRGNICRSKVYDYAIKELRESNYSRAIEVFEALGSYSDSSQQIPRIHYAAGMSYRNQGAYSSAIKEFTLAGQYEDATDQILATYYSAGVEQKASGNWEEAVKSFTLAGNYKDASDQIYDTYYCEGLAKRADAHWEEAISAFRSAGEYRDAPTQILATYYAEGEKKRDLNDWHGAIEAFTSAGEYNDAKTQISATYYAQGEAYFNNNDYWGAIYAYQSANGYSDSSMKILAAHYSCGDLLDQMGNWEGAIVEYELAEDYLDAKQKVIDCKEKIYQLAESYYQQGEWYQAIDNYLLIPDYKNAEERSRETKLKAFSTKGSIIQFGQYEQDGDVNNGSENIEWIVLDVQDNKSFVISLFVLDAKPYESDNKYITWEDCTLRKWLNHIFLQNSFTENEQSAIILTHVDNSGDQNYNNSGSGQDTDDKIFLLSYAEAWKYFITQEERIGYATEYARQNGVFHSVSDIVKTGKIHTVWWLRSSNTDYGVRGYKGDKPDSFSAATSIEINGKRHLDVITDDYVGVRPAMWIDLDSEYFK